MKQGGQFVFEFGGFGNNHLIHTTLEKEFEKRGYQYEMPFYFPTIGQYSSLLETVGFEVKYAALFDRMTELKGQDGLSEWIDMFVKAPFYKVSCQEKQSIIRAAVKTLYAELYRNGHWYADYVRLRMKAIKK